MPQRNQPAVKIAVKQEGWYRIAQADLAAAGLDPRTDPNNVQLFVDGQELPIKVVTDASGKLAAIEFYGMGLDTAATNTRVYWLVAGTQAGRRIPVITNKGAGLSATSFAYTAERKDRARQRRAVAREPADLSRCAGTRKRAEPAVLYYDDLLERLLP